MLHTYIAIVISKGNALIVENYQAPWYKNVLKTTASLTALIRYYYYQLYYYQLYRLKVALL